MNSFGVNLTGKKAIYSKATFYKQNATRASRTFLCEGGPGSTKEGGGTLGSLFGPRTLSGRWESDGTRDTIDAGQLEAYIDDAGNEIAAPSEKLKIDAYVVDAPGGSTKPVGTALPEPAEPKKRSATQKANDCITEKANPKQPRVASESAKGTGAPWNPDEAIQMYKDGKTPKEIAVHFGYDKDPFPTRLRTVLVNAGVYKSPRK